MIAGVTVIITQKPEDFIDLTPRLAEREGWHHSEMNAMEAVQSSEKRCFDKRCRRLASSIQQKNAKIPLKLIGVNRHLNPRPKPGFPDVNY